MVVLADTKHMGSGRGRAEALERFHAMGAPLQVDVDVSDSAFDGVIEAWQLDIGLRALRNVCTAHRVWTTARGIRAADEPDRMTLGMKLGASGHVTTCSADMALDAGDLYLSEQTSPMEYTSDGSGGLFVFTVDLDRLGFSVDVVRSAMGRLRSSPLYALMQNHLAQLSELPDFSQDLTQMMVSSATLELTRALVATAAGDDHQATSAMRETEFTRVLAYVRMHIADSDLSPAVIARASHMSVRQLYKVWDSHEETLAQYIMRLRLACVRTALSAPGQRRVPIAEVAAAWGFANAAHFSSRFRAAYDMTPREWRRLASDSNER